MADQLVTLSELASFVQSDLDASTANLVVNAATAAVQAACGQRLVAVVADEVTILGTTESVLWLPERPVTLVTSVELDGDALTDYRLMGASRLWRSRGWQAVLYEPSDVVVVYSHGYATGHQDLEFARSVVLSVARGCYVNPGGVSSEKIDDYAVAYERAVAQLEESPNVKKALTKKYGRPAGAVRVGGS